MTKEEILGKYDEGYITQPEVSDVVERHNALKAMDEYAQQQSIAFAEWLNENRWYNYDIKLKKWCYTFEQGTAIGRKVYEKNYMKTSEELYNRFLESTNKPHVN